VSKDGAAVAPQPSAATAAGGTAVSIAAPEGPAKTDYVTVNAPLTGIFYRSPSPQTDAFIQVGSEIAKGDVIGLIEAMKLFNEVHSTVAGRVKRMIAENGQLVRAHQPLVEFE